MSYVTRRSFLKSSIGAVGFFVFGLPDLGKASLVPLELEITPENLLASREVVLRAVKLDQEKMETFLGKLAIYLMERRYFSVIPGSHLTNLSLFFSSIPTRRFFFFLCCVDPIKRNSQEFKEITRIHIRLMKLPEYHHNCYDRCVKYSECYERDIKYSEFDKGKGKRKILEEDEKRGFYLVKKLARSFEIRDKYCERL